MFLPAGVGANGIAYQHGVLDGLALDVQGNVYVAAISHSAIVRVRRGSAIDVIADATDGLDWPSSVAFGASKGTRRRLYAVNYAIGPRCGSPPGAGPASLAVDVGVREAR